MTVPSPANPSAHGLLVKLRGTMPGLRPAERRVAQAVLDDPGAAADLSITALAKRCETSSATVMRLVKALEFSRYPDFRMALVWENSRAAAVKGAKEEFSQEIDPNDSVQDIVTKITFNEARAIEETASALKIDSLRKAIELVAKTPRIDVYGVGASAFVAQDLQQKLVRITRTAFAWPDPHAAITSAALLEKGSVAIGISHSGNTADTVDALSLAQQNGATTIAITNFSGTKLTAVADLVLHTAARETTFRSGATSSRIAQLAVVDCLFVGVAQATYDESLTALERTFNAIRSRRT